MSVCEEDEELQSWGWTDLSSSLWDSQKEHQDLLMSRRSLRLDEGLLDRSLPHSSASFSVGGASWRSNRPLKCRRAQHLSASCSESLLLASPPRRAASLLSSSLHSVASDASLLSSLLDESSVQESTVVDTFWGLDQDIDPKESTIVSDQISLDPDDRCPKHLVQTLSRVPCKDCEHQSVSTNRSSSKYTSSSEPEASTIYCRDRSRRRKTARSGLCGVMDLKESTTTQKELHPNGSLSDAYKRLNRRWRHMTSGFLLTGFPLLLLVVLLPLLLLFFSLCWFGPAALWSVLPAVDVTERGPLVSGLSSVGGFLSFQSRPAEGAVEEREVQPPAAGEEDGSAAVDGSAVDEADGSAAVDGSAVDEADGSAAVDGSAAADGSAADEADGSAAADEADGSAAVDGSVRLGCLEESLAELWGHVEAGGQRADQRHQELLQLYADLQQLVSDQRHGEEQQPWMTALLDQKLDQLGKGLDEDRRLTEKQDSFQQQSETSRLDLLELQLQTLAARTEEVQWSREAAATVSPSSALVAAGGGGVDRQSHDALLAEVARLQEALEEVRRDVEGLSVCQDGCRRLDTIQQTISAQVREEVRVLVYGNRVGGDGAPGLPEESLLWWLSQHHVSGSDLQEALLSLELSILQNVRLQLEQHRDEEPVRDAAGTAVTQEDVQETVKNALRLFSQDRTGLADFALESGGGSILSTRCSETYETKAALLSLFGLPLWYFSQSPRVVIQPHVQPGNCWAFRGSTGVLVIRLSMRILPTAVTMEHIPRTLAPSGTLTSAPRDFTVYGLEGEAEVRGKLLGSFTFDQDGEALQSYRLTEENDVAFQIIEVQVLSNWGHQEYTCMYRFRVHGTPEDPRDVQSADLRDGRVLAADGVSSH